MNQQTENRYTLNKKLPQVLSSLSLLGSSMGEYSQTARHFEVGNSVTKFTSIFNPSQQGQTQKSEDRAQSSQSQPLDQTYLELYVLLHKQQQELNLILQRGEYLTSCINVSETNIKKIDKFEQKLKKYVLKSL
ncbi:Hypothetical_protein [Hexamita inflata]|uniref:Hypothetical_protein n=1 Tax=Hexamita inflata TaxID=28002 RepID=A0AA86NZT5_9EUKA|nr:Hypothetical protein HINF_LOCUS17427 [Hexamita inflata]